MCYTCWVDRYSSAAIDNCKVRLAEVAILTIYDTHCAGGNLHCLLDDWNIDGALAFEKKCLKEAKEEGFKANAVVGENLEGWKTRLRAEHIVVRLFERMTVAERASALALSEDFWQITLRAANRAQGSTI